MLPYHLIGKYFKHDVLNVKKEPSKTTFLNRTDINDLLTRTRSMLEDVGKLNFDIPLALSDDDFFNLTGLNRGQFDVCCLACQRLEEFQCTYCAYVPRHFVGEAPNWLIKCDLGNSLEVASSS